MKRENRTKKNIRKRKRRKKRYLLKFMLFVLLCAGLHYVMHLDHFTVNGIIVAGNKEISDQDILKLSELQVGENIFDMHPFFAERRIKKNLYVEDVNVKREFPDKIKIIVEERRGKAQFVMGKKYVITDNDGKVLEIAAEERKTTLIDGVDVEDARLNKKIEVKQSGTYEKAMAIVSAAETGDLYFKKLVISGNDVEAYVYDELVCKGKYSDLLSCIETEALKAVIFDLYQKGTEKGTINIGDNNYCSFTP